MTDLLLGARPRPEDNVPAGNTLPTSAGIKTFFADGRNDMQRSGTGDLETLYGPAKLKQAILKALMTVRGSNTEFPFYGTILQDLIGKKMNIAELRATARSEVETGLLALQYLQKDLLDLDEQLDTLDDVQVESEEDLSGIVVGASILIKCTTKAGTVITTDVTIGE